MTQTLPTPISSEEPKTADLSVLANRMGERLGETAQAIDDVARSTCLLALEVAVEADRPGHLGKGLAKASLEVRQLAARTQHSLTELESMLRAVEGRAA